MKQFCVYILQCNDVLLIPLSLGAVLLALHSWQNAAQPRWMSAFAVASLAVLTKLNALLLLPWIGLCIVLDRSANASRKILRIAGGGMIAVLLTGWYAALRVARDAQVDMVANVTNLSSALKLPTGWEQLFSFRLLRILDQPFNNAWSDEARREYFLEYLVRSSLFGEFQFPWKVGASVFLLLLLLLLFLALWGTVLQYRRPDRAALPMGLLFAVFLTGHLLFRIHYPYAPSQDFRYSTLLLIPIAWTLATLRERNPKTRMVVDGTVTAFCTLAIVFVLRVSLGV